MSNLTCVEYIRASSRPHLRFHFDGPPYYLALIWERQSEFGSEFEWKVWTTRDMSPAFVTGDDDEVFRFVAYKMRNNDES